MIRITFDFRQPFRTGYGRTVVVQTREAASAAIHDLIGDAMVTITEMRELSDAEYARWQDYQRRVTEWTVRAKEAKAARGLL